MLKLTKWFQRHPSSAALLSACFMTLGQIHVFPNAWMLPPKIFGWFAWFSLVPVLCAVDGENSLGGFFKKSWFGFFIYFFITLYWVTIAMSVYGGLPWVLSIAILGALCAFLAALMAGGVSAGFLYHRRFALPLVLCLPLSWIAAEYVRTYLFSGFPWANLADGQVYTSLHLIQIADITGENGVTALMVFANVIFLEILLRRVRRTQLAAFAVLIGISFTYGFFKLAAYETRAQISDPAALRLAALQGNIPQNEKWNLAFREKILRQYQKLGEAASQQGSDLIIWPEAALPFTLPRQFAGLPADKFGYLFGDQPKTYLVGAVLNDDEDLYNSAVLLSPQGEKLGDYAKSHLVPLGEYVPLKDSLLFFVDEIVPAVGDFKPGREVRPIVWKTINKNSVEQTWKLGLLVCYEDIFPAISRNMAKEGAQVLINMTNDAWYGRTSGPYQHLGISSYRAVETRLPMIRATNTGISAVVSPTGKILDQLPWYQEGFLLLDLPPQSPALTWYVRLGPWLSQGAVAFCVLAGLWLWKRHVVFKRGVR